MAEISIKPLSVNHSWGGRTFKSAKYKKYISDVLAILPDDICIPEGKLKIRLEFGLSSAGGDWDNPIKPFVDILQLKYGFNDSRIYRAEVIKTIVKKKEEFIRFEIMPLEGD